MYSCQPITLQLCDVCRYAGQPETAELPVESVTHVPTVLTKLQKWGDYPGYGQPVWPTKFIPMVSTTIIYCRLSLHHALIVAGSHPGMQCATKHFSVGTVGSV